MVLTEPVEENTLTGQKEPVISALHLRNAKDGIEVINIASVYGKNLKGLQNMLNHDLVTTLNPTVLRNYVTKKRSVFQAERLSRVMI